MNVVLICLDTFRSDIIGPGKKLSFVETPNLDDFAGQAVSFGRAFGESQPTLQCRRAFMTGRRGFPYKWNFDRRGHWHHAPGWHKIPPEQDTLAEILLKRGYWTGLIADVYHLFKPTMNYSRGFASYEFIRGQESDNYRGGTFAMIEEQMKRHAREPLNWQRHQTTVQYLWNMRGRQSEDDYLVGKVMNRACQWLDDCHQQAPFLLWVEAFDPHEPWDPPTAYADGYAAPTGKDFIMPGAAWEGGDPTEAEIERIKALYYGEVTFVDKYVGRVLDKLDELKLWDDTVVVILSDHGTEVMDHGKFGKGPGELHPFNTGLVWHLRHPDGPKGKRVNALVQAHDVMPTVLSLLDVPFEGDGENVWPVVTGQQQSVRDHCVIGWAGWSSGTAKGRASVRDDDWNYVVSVGEPDPNPELYNLAADPDEVTNVHDKHPAVVAERKARLEAVLKQPAEEPQNEVCAHPVPVPIGEWFRGRQWG